MAFKFSYMKKKFLFFIFHFSLFTFHSSAQLYQAHSSQFMDFTSNQKQLEETDFELDTAWFKMANGGMNFYFEVVSMQTVGSNRQYKLLDKNDDTVYCTYNPRMKYIDYKVQNYYLRYVLDKITEVKDESEDTTADVVKLDSLGNEIEDTTIYDEADVMPEYPGGKGEMMNYFSQNLKYPKEAAKQKLQGFVRLNAVVEKDGTLSNIIVLKDIGGGCGAEAVRVAKTTTGWTPGERKGKPVRVRTEFLVGFPPVTGK